MKRIFMMSTLAFFSSIAMEQGELVKQAEAAKSAERQPEQEVAKRARPQKVETLYACSLRASLALLKESGEKVIDFIEQITVNDCPAYPCAQLIELYIKDLEAKTLADPTGPCGAKLNRERIELAAYCVTKSFALYIKSNKTGPIPHPFLVDEQRIEGAKKGATKVCPFAELGLKLLKNLLDDKFFEDQAVVQPLALICMAKSIRSIRVDDQRNIPLNVGYEKLKGFLLHNLFLLDPLNEDKVIHAVRQLIVRDEFTALKVLEVIQQKREEIIDELHLCLWANIFNRPLALGWLRQRRAKDEGFADMIDVRLCSCKGNIHSMAHFERAVYLGDVEYLKAAVKAYKQPVENLLNDVAYVGDSCCDVMFAAAGMGYIKLVKFCLQKELKVNAGHILIAAHMGQVAVLKLLLPHFDGLLSADGYPGESECFRAVDQGYLETINCIIDKVDCELFGVMLARALDRHAGLRQAEKKASIVGFLLDNVHRVVGDGKTKAKIIRKQFCDAIAGFSPKIALGEFTKRAIALNGFSDAAIARSNPLRHAACAIIELINRVRTLGPAQTIEAHELASQCQWLIESIDFLLEYGARDEPDSKGVTTLSYLEESKARLIAENEKETDPDRVMGIGFLDAIIKKIAAASLQDVPAREEKYTEGLMHFPKPTA